MPASVLPASPTVVLPAIAYSGFTCYRNFESVVNQYRNGFRQTNARTTISRKQWTLTGRVTAAELSTLVTFYNANAHRAFYFYDRWETSPKFSHDATGAATTGRYTVRFEGPFEATHGIARNDVSIRLIEIV